MNPTIFLLNGPNLNLLGSRDPEIYGRESLADIEAACRAHAAKLGLKVDCRQSNHEGVLIDWIHEARASADGIVINPGAFSHTSIAMRDAIDAFTKPVVEVHLSNIYRREPFRHHSYISPAAKGVICGLGSLGYFAALDAQARWLTRSAPPPAIQEA